MKQVNALKRGLQILRALNEHGIRQVKDLHRVTGLPKPTVVRMLETLIAEGCVTRDGQNGYRLSAGVLSLSQGFDSADFLLQAATSVLAAMREEFAWPVELAVFDRDAMVVLGTGASPGTMSLNRPGGARLPMLVTALGRAYLAFCPPDEREPALDLLRGSTDPKNALARDDQAVARILDRTRRNGYAVNDREHLTTTRAVAVPVLVHGLPAACISMMAVASAMTMKQAVDSFAAPLRSAAGAVAEGLTSGTGQSAAQLNSCTSASATSK
jgi:IclR family mhp operon transcriptional activator